VLGNEAEEWNLIDLAGTDIEKDCNSEFIEDCLRNQLVYRASFILAVMFGGLGLLSGLTSCFDKGFWVPKVILPVLALFVSIWMPNKMFTAWSELSRVGGFFWLFFQSMLVLEVAFELHQFLLDAADGQVRMSNANTAVVRYAHAASENTFLAIYLGVTVFCYIGAGVGIVLLFVYHNCPVANFFTSMTLIVNLALGGISMLESVSGGGLTPAIVALYSVYLNWYAVSSSPDTDCNDLASESYYTRDERDICATFSIVFLMITMLWVAWKGTAVLSLFTSTTKDGGLKTTQDAEAPLTAAADVDERKGVDDDDDSDRACCCAGDASAEEEKRAKNPRAERVFFHTVMALTALHACMTVTSWSTSAGEPVGESHDDRPFHQAMWEKIVAQWLMFAVFMRALYVLYKDGIAGDDAYATMQ